MPKDGTIPLIDFEDGDIPESWSQAKYNASPAGRSRRGKYRHDNSKHTTDAVYLAREFVAWDGEGVTIDGKHLYVLLANSRGGYLAEESGLSTAAVLAFLESETSRYPNAIHVIYGGGYDFNCWLADLSRTQVAQLYKSRSYNVGAYRISWRQGKSFTLSRGENPERASATIYDVVSFFQCAFVKACDDYLGDAFVERAMIVENKALRQSFRLADLPEIRRYNDFELVNLVALMTELRLRLNRCGLRPRRWDGPGAIASALLTREGVKHARHESPTRVAQAARFAYAGGRFEVVRYGSVNAPAYEYDINSAYPAALRHVPNLATGHWEYHSTRSPEDGGFALYHLQYSDGPERIAGPLFCRAPNGTICYPQNVTGWYWGPEAGAAAAYVKQYGGQLKCLGTWVYQDDGTRPFAFIDGLYLKRQALKRAKDGAHVGIKLGLNSLYGKLAQQVGWQPPRDDKPLRIPPFHQIEWAGYTTSYARATILQAAMTNLEAVIAFETDAVFSSEPLDVPLGNALGEFEETRFSTLTYLQSGLYFGAQELADRSVLVNKTRGIDRGSVHRGDALLALQEPDAADRVLQARLTRFVGIGLALAQSWERWRIWEVMPKRINLTPQGKRAHWECAACDDSSLGLTLDRWHDTLCPYMGEHVSSEFPIAWINPNPDMKILDDLREEKYESDRWETD